jgi:peptide/nickel transport system substrate-binding protein/oligopeptide transport system substrate-binding protein
VQISIGEPWYEFPYVLTDPATAPIPAAAFQADPAGFMRHPVGSGPYELAPGGGLDNLVLQRWKGYGGPQPSVATVRFLVDRPTATAVGDLDAGRLDVAQVAPDDMPAALARFGSRGFTPLAAGIYFGFNLKDPALADVRLRQAVSLALDRQAIADRAYGPVLEPADSLVPTSLPGHGVLSCAAMCAYDPGRARALVQQAFGGATPAIGFDYPVGASTNALVPELTSELAAVGIKLTWRPHTPEDYLGLLNGNGQEAFDLVWVADYPLADWFLSPLFRSGSADNHTAYESVAADGLIDQARATADPTHRLDLYRQAEQQVLADMAASPIGFFRNRYAAVPRVRGFYADAVGGFEVARLSLGRP